MGSETLDVVIIGAGLSGVGAAVHLQKEHPDKSFALLEMRGAMGGTWDLFRYPGVRSDSSMFTLGYGFKPWTSPKAIADGPSIRGYIEETAAEHGIEAKIRYRHKVTGLAWSSRSARWTIDVERTDTGETLQLESRFVLCCAGYYRYDRGYAPEFPGQADFRGQVIHPQFWPEDLDYAGKRIVVIGSGATAVTLIPALTDKAAHVTMLQRSPVYMASVPGNDPHASRLRELLPEEVAYGIVRARSALFGLVSYGFTRTFPEKAKRFLVGKVEEELGEGADMRHFTPRHAVWDERLCAVPDGDMFDALRAGRASVVTDRIERFTEKGIRLGSGEELEADIIVTATGLELQMVGGANLSVDGEPVKVAEKLYYKGAMLEDVPNFFVVFGYTNSSWTLKADLIFQYVCRVLGYMDEHGHTTCTPRNHGPVEDSEPFLTLTAGYIQRASALLPRQARRDPWKMHQNYLRDYVLLRLRRIDDGMLRFSQLEKPASPRGVVASTPARAAGASPLD